MVPWRAVAGDASCVMMQNDRFGMHSLDRIRLSSREIAVAVALTVAAATFLVTTMMGDKSGDGSPVAAVERTPQKM